MRTKASRLLFGVALGAMLMLLIAQTPAAARDRDRGDHNSLTGTWNVTLKFPQCSSTCPCPGGTPNLPIPALQMYIGDGSMQEAGGGALFRGPGLGAWYRIGFYDYLAHFKFFTFTNTGGPGGNEVVTSHITLTAPDTFTAMASYTLTNAAGRVIGQACEIDETGARFTRSGGGDED